MMGGTIEVQSIEGQGSTFRFNVCLRTAQASLSGPIREDSHEEQARSLLGARVLVVEDNTLNQEVFMDLLQRAGVQVVVAGNGEEALVILARDTAFDAVLMDCQMPILDGYQATARIRQELHLDCLPIIAVTANLPGEVQARILAAGMNDCVVKPLEVETFYRTLCRWIGRGTLPTDEGARNPYALGAGGIDLAHGLAVAGHDPALHQRLLRMFLRDNQELLAQLWSAHECNDRPSLAALAHGLRGSAGHIGAMAVQAAAARLEQGAERNEDTLAPMLALSACLQSLLATLTSVPTLAPDVSPLGKGAGPTLPPTEVERLASLLLESNAQALDVIEALCQRDAGGQLLEVREAIYRMDFTCAHRLLSAIRA